MKKKYMYLITILFVLIFLVIFYVEITPKIRENNIKKQIDKANFCTENSDCINAGSKCPFGCWNYVNKNEVERISKLINSFDSKCVYGCINCEKSICENNKCVPVCE